MSTSGWTFLKDDSMPVSMNTIEAKEGFSELLNRVSQQNERVLLVRRDKPIAAIVPIADFNRLQLMQDQEDVQEAIEALHEVREKGSFTIHELEQQQR